MQAASIGPMTFCSLFVAKRKADGQGLGLRGFVCACRSGPEVSSTNEGILKFRAVRVEP